MSFRRQGKWITIGYALRTARERREAFNDAIISACFSGEKKVEKEKDGILVSSGKKCPNYVFCVSYARLQKNVASFLYEPFTGFTLEDYALLKPFDFSQALRVGKHMCKAVAFIHKLGICHRNINPDTFVVVLENEKGKAKATAKLWKFGNSCPLKEWGLGEIVEPENTAYSAPETRVKSNVLSRQDWVYADRYSLGLCLEYLFTMGKSGKAGTSGKAESLIKPKELAEFIEQLKNTRARRRPSALAAVNFFEQL
ncbi:putative serine/threonine protein kinase [Tunisvirus fontaine2]|uniref:Putative serine/threonine protein kinase n=1 Tax=Tunisvirus fontaine2 TaxID=1421067 RepID=V9SE51_9VIRU|nr:putative serine/threonine protein kinase [Tunisvirus fontaine2]AHC55015.1 putative serine/threonine protein kinase [Tunisvirus fontaine2]